MVNDTSKLIQALGIEHASLEEQAGIIEKVDKRLQEVVVKTLVENLSEQEAKKMRKLLAETDMSIEDEVAKIAATIPRLAEKIERAVAEEIGRLRAVLSA